MEVSNLFVCLMGMGVTFIGLICLILLITLMGKIVGGGTAAKTAEPSPLRRPGSSRGPRFRLPRSPGDPQPGGSWWPPCPPPSLRSWGLTFPPSRILSLTPVGGAAYTVLNRGEVVAAVSAAIAEELGTDISAIRILSLTPVGGAAYAVPNRGEVVAAVSAAIAEAAGHDVSRHPHPLSHSCGRRLPVPRLTGEPWWPPYPPPSPRIWAPMCPPSASSPCGRRPDIAANSGGARGQKRARPSFSSRR